MFALLGGHPSPVLVDAVLPVEDGLEADLRGDRLHVQNDVLEMENRDRDEGQGQRIKDERSKNVMKINQESTLTIVTNE